MEDINGQVGRRIRALRERKGLTQEGLAAKCGLHHSHMGEIERGELNVTVKTLKSWPSSATAADAIAERRKGIGLTGFCSTNSA